VTFGTLLALYPFVPDHAEPDASDATDPRESAR
jgi:hypothetical protein